MNRNLGPQWQVQEMPGFRSGPDHPPVAFEAVRDGGRIGKLLISPSKYDGLVVNNIEVAKEHRRQGVAASLYKAASEAHGGAPIDHLPGAMTQAAKRTVGRLAETQPDMHRRVVRDRNGNSRVRSW